MSPMLEIPPPAAPASPFRGNRALRVLCWVAGGPRIGMGHVRRSLELARTLTGAGLEIAGFICNDDPISLRALAVSGGQVWQEQDAAAAVAAVDVLLVDRPEGGDRQIKRLRAEHPALHVAALDHFDMEDGAADLVINLFNHHPSLSRSLAAHVGYHEGLDYAIIRPSFLVVRDRPRCIPQRARQVIVSFGGADPRNHSALVLDALAEGAPPETTVRLVIGPSFSQAATVTARARTLGVEILEQVADLAPWFAEADLAVSGGGTTMLELACTGTPTLVLPQTEAEARFAASLAARGAVRLGRPVEGSDGFRRDLIALINDQPARRRLNAAALATVDGRGRERIAGLLATTFTPSSP